MNKFITMPLLQKINKYLLLILILSSCSAPQKMVLNTSFTTIYKSSNGTYENPSYLHITNNEDYIKFIETQKIDESEFDKLVVVNFKENDVVVLNQGKKSTGGYAIDVEKISWENETLSVQKSEIVPNKGDMVTMAFTSPFCVTIIPKAKNIKIL